MPLTTPALSVTEAATVLRLDDDSVRALIHSGQLVAFNAAASPKAKRPTWRITAEALEQFIAKRSSRPATPAPAVRRPRAKAGGNVIEFFR